MPSWSAQEASCRHAAQKEPSEPPILGYGSPWTPRVERVRIAGLSLAFCVPTMWGIQNTEFRIILLVGLVPGLVLAMVAVARYPRQGLAWLALVLNLITSIPIVLPYFMGI